MAADSSPCHKVYVSSHGGSRLLSCCIDAGERSGDGPFRCAQGRYRRLWMLFRYSTAAKKFLINARDVGSIALQAARSALTFTIMTVLDR